MTPPHQMPPRRLRSLSNLEDHPRRACRNLLNARHRKGADARSCRSVAYRHRADGAGVVAEVQPEGIGANMSCTKRARKVFTFGALHEGPRGGQRELEMRKRRCVVPERLNGVFGHRRYVKKGSSLKGDDVFVVQGRRRHGRRCRAWRTAREERRCRTRPSRRERRGIVCGRLGCDRYSRRKGMLSLVGLWTTSPQSHLSTSKLRNGAIRP